ncbi:prepilin peptidase [Brasilonema bromeliae]|uniref:Prepilin leader peptidase/N-methyltransferase n=1 Tax=Brasilonema bromeliae SPC951 TaxID=385972 RepID=A0ABX1PAT2_9CYAN|nr:A24 family peptidase [Brasilonema bromeliae]NMG21471.1 prepilin peptidase [Brasilonema bromeliae SPC951]
MFILIIVQTSFIVFALGTSIGSFINVIVYRLPIGLSIIFPPSHCPHCLNQLKPYDNVPLLGWLWLRGRCRYCKRKISIRYPVVEGVTGFLFLFVFWMLKFSPYTVGYWAFCSWLLALSLIDLDTMTLPNSLTKSGLVVGIIFHMVCGFLPEASWVGLVHHLKMAIGGGVLGLWLFDAIAIIGSIVFGKTAMGTGDTKLAAMMGVWLGWKYLLLASFLACLVGVVVSGGKMILSQHSSRIPLSQKWGEKIPFGPFLACGAVISLFGGEAILSFYLQLFFPIS